MIVGSAIVALTLALGAALPAPAAEEDVTVIRQLRRSGPAGAASRGTPVVTWIGRNAIRVDEGEERTILLRRDDGRARVLDHAGRTWREAAIAPGAERSSAAGPAVTGTTETRAIGALLCRKYLLVLQSRLGNAAPPLTRSSEVWASEEAGASADPRVLAALLGVPLIPIDSGLAGELRTIRGLPVLQVERTTLLGSTEERTTELVSVEVRRAAPETWEVPAGYTPAGP